MSRALATWGGQERQAMLLGCSRPLQRRTAPSPHERKGQIRVTATLTALLVLVTLTAAAGASNTLLLRGPGSIQPSVRDNRIGLKVERRATNRVLERRCRPGRYWPQVRSVWKIRRYNVEATLQRELRRQRYAQTLGSRCLPVRLRRVYDRIPAWRQNAWQDIHVCEGSWTDTGDPYWGGLQMDWDFMRGYGADALRWYGGPANLWPWYVQTVVADRAWQTRRFYPWPTCARKAGLI